MCGDKTLDGLFEMVLLCVVCVAGRKMHSALIFLVAFVISPRSRQRRDNIYDYSSGVLFQPVHSTGKMVDSYYIRGIGTYGARSGIYLGVCVCVCCGRIGMSRVALSRGGKMHAYYYFLIVPETSIPQLQRKQRKIFLSHLHSSVRLVSLQ